MIRPTSVTKQDTFVPTLQQLRAEPVKDWSPTTRAQAQAAHARSAQKPQKSPPICYH
jgi:hypothetical protein